MPRGNGNVVRVFRYPVPQGSAAVHRKGSTANSPQALWRYPAGCLLLTARMHCGNVPHEFK